MLQCNSTALIEYETKTAEEMLGIINNFNTFTSLVVLIGCLLLIYTLYIIIKYRCKRSQETDYSCEDTIHIPMMHSIRIWLPPPPYEHPPPYHVAVQME